MDFSSFPDSGRHYAGSERKLGIVMDDGPYMVKFQSRDAFGMRFNHVSEHLGSSIFRLAGMEAQETILGTYGDRQVVVCRDFNVEGSQFVPFNDVGESTLEEDRDAYQYEYADIMRMLEDNGKLTDVPGTIAAFWRMYVVDALIGNFDRHGANWGFLKEGNRYRLAPVFDNGSCLFPRLRDDGALREVMDSEREMLRRVYEFPTSQVRLGGRKSSYYDVISSGAFPECAEALAYVLERLDMGEVFALVDALPRVSEARREFYRRMLDARYRLILLGEAPRPRGRSA